METSQFVPGWTSLKFPSGFELDLMTFLKGFPVQRFEESYNQATLAEIHGVPVRFLNIHQLIESKKATNRPKDILDVEALEKVIKES